MQYKAILVMTKAKAFIPRINNTMYCNITKLDLKALFPTQYDIDEMISSLDK